LEPMKSTSTVLIVDDEPMILEFLEALLIPEGYNLAFANNGTEALQQAAALTPDLILLDVMMPDMTGFEVCRRLRKDPQLAEVPVIMVTALDDREARLEGIEVGADDFISKPVDQVELRARVRTIIRLNRYRRLRAERAKFEWVVEHASDGYLIVDDSDQIQYANQQARHYLGLAANEDGTYAGTFLDVAGKQYRCEPQMAWAKWPEQSSSQPLLYLVQPETATNNAFWLHVDILHVDPSVAANGSKIIRLHDVTAQMALQREKWEFHAVISHKLRTPLAGTMFGLETLARDASNLSQQEITEISSLAYRNMRRLYGEIEDILKYMNVSHVARPGAGLKLAQIEPVVEQICQNLDLNSVEISGPERLGQAQTRLSEQAMELVLWEVLENAQKFHPENNPAINITIAPQNNNRVNIQVSDNGLSLSAEQLAQIWNPYYQGEKYLTGEVAGMGLGLSMVAALIWGVGGTCRAYNQKEGPGIVIELELPLEQSNPAANDG